MAKGKRALSVANVAALPDVIATIMAAVMAGELDGAIDTAVSPPKGKLSKG